VGIDRVYGVVFRILYHDGYLAGELAATAVFCQDGSRGRDRHGISVDEIRTSWRRPVPCRSRHTPSTTVADYRGDAIRRVKPLARLGGRAVT